MACSVISPTASSLPGASSPISVPTSAWSSRRPDTKSLWRCVSSALVTLTRSELARLRYVSTSRSGSMTAATPRSRSATRKLALPSSSAAKVSTVNIGLEKDEGSWGRSKQPQLAQLLQQRLGVRNKLQRDHLRDVVRHQEIDEAPVHVCLLVNSPAKRLRAEGPLDKVAILPRHEAHVAFAECPVPTGSWRCKQDEHNDNEASAGNHHCEANQC